MGLFGDDETRRFGQALADELSRRFPPSLVGEQGKNREANTLKALDHVSSAVRMFKRGNKVGVLKQIGLSKKFQERLAEVGYEGEFIKAATVRLAQAMSGK